MSTRIKKLILKGIIVSLISIPMCAKLINLSKYEGNLSQYSFYLSKSGNAYPGTLIRLGNKGENVSKVQKRLNELGFNAGSADGIFGNLTKTAVMNFQRSKGLDADGIIGSLTWKALFESTNTYPGTLIMLGSSGQNVVKLQQKLNELGFNAGSADGIFGNLTKTAVMNFQRNKGLDVDGIVGQMTWNSLFSKEEVVVPGIPDEEEPKAESPSDSTDKDNSVEEDSNKNNSIEDNKDNLVEDSNNDNFIDNDINKDDSVEDSNNGDTSVGEDNSSEDDSSESDSSEVVNTADLVEFAYKFIGRPYVWGSAGPDAFDCGGFTSYIYKNIAGIDIGRIPSLQIKMGTRVERSELKLGDLVFPHSGHVGIYVGNGKMIHAPQTGDVVKITDIYQFSTARRII